MADVSLLVLAGGMGSRYGGSKQTAGVGPAGEWLLDYALYDAREAGIRRAVVVVRPGAERDFDDLRERARDIDLAVVPQHIDLPSGLGPTPRPVPWGTGHAVLAARQALGGGPFATVNADDFYGREAYAIAATAADAADNDAAATLVAMRLASTLSPHGPVTRAICTVSGTDLVGLEEVRGLARSGDDIRSDRGADVDPDTLVSMNFWLLPAGVPERLARGFDRFVRSPGADRHEFLLPTALSELISTGELTVRVRQTPGPWFGLTHAGDRPGVVEALRRLTDAGVYPSPLWAG